MTKQVIEIDSVETLVRVQEARARIAVYAATIKAVLAGVGDFEDLEDFAGALVEALMENASKDEAFVRSHVKEPTND